MKWYSKYLPVYEKPFAEVPAETVAEVRAKLAERQSDRPLATVSVIACNEEKRLTACLWSLAEQRCRYPMEIIATETCRRTARRRFSKPSVCRGSAKRRPDAAMHASAD